MNITAETAELFDTIEGQMKALYTEISVLSSKKPDGAVNKFKVQIINELITSANSILGKHLPLKDFSLFDDQSLPTASDCVLVISQYLNSMSRFRHDHTTSFSGQWWWMDNFTKIRKTVGSNYNIDLRRRAE